MRAIKFRAWQKTHKYMTTDLHWHDGVFYYADYEDGIRCEEDWAVMQFTGLKDKNGKEIFEGDILARGFHGHWLVEFNDAAFLARKDRDKGRTDEVFMCDVYLGSAEVIGNIYENPELVKL